MSAIEKGYKAVSDALLPYVDDVNREWLARQLIDIWLRATNPMGLKPSETIYDDLYRLRAGARTVLTDYDEALPIDDAMETLRSTLRALGALENSV